MSHKPSTRHRGGQPGNQNRLKHGLYSKQVSMEDREQLDTMSVDLTRNELALARVRLMTCLEKQLSASPEDWLGYEKAAAYYLNVIVSLIHRNARDNRRAAASQSLME